MNNNNNQIKVNLKKIVRNNIKDILANEKQDPNYGLIDYHLYTIDPTNNNKIVIRLKKKLLEEVKELKQAVGNFVNTNKELADIYEVLLELMGKYNISYNDFQEIKYIPDAFIIDDERYTQLITEDKENKQTCSSEQYKNHIINYLRYICSKKLLNNDKISIKKNNLIEFGQAFLFLLKQMNISLSLLMSYKNQKKESQGGFSNYDVLNYIIINKKHSKYYYYMNKYSINEKK